MSTHAKRDSPPRTKAEARPGEGGGGEDDVEARLPVGDDGFGHARRLEAGDVDACFVATRRQRLDAEAAIGAGGHAPRFRRPRDHDRNVGEGGPVARAHGANERGGRFGSCPRGHDETEEDGCVQDDRNDAHETSSGEGFASGLGTSVAASAPPTSSSSFTREASRFSRSGQVSWLPGRRLAPCLPRPPWPSGGASRRSQGAGSPATVAGPRRPSTCFPLSPPKREAP